MLDYNQKYYDRAVQALQDIKYYTGDIKGDCALYLLRWYPDADIKDINHAIDWALSDTWGGGCEFEII